MAIIFKKNINDNEFHEMDALQSDPWIRISASKDSIENEICKSQENMHSNKLNRNISIISTKVRIKEAAKDLSAGILQWFGVSNHPLTTQSLDTWQNRVLLAHTNNHLLGGYKENLGHTFDSELCAFSNSKYPSPAPPYSDGTRTPHPVDPLSVRSRRVPSRQASKMSATSKTSGPQALQRQESVVRMAIDGVKYLVGSNADTRRTIIHSRSYSPHQLSKVDSLEEDLDDVFFNNVGSTSPAITGIQEKQLFDRNRLFPVHDGVVAFNRSAQDEKIEELPLKPGWGQNRYLAVPPEVWGLHRVEEGVVKENVGPGRAIGRGFAGFITEAEFRRSRMDSEIHRQINGLGENRSFFTYWVTFVQITIYLISIFTYDLAPFGVSLVTVTSEVLKPNLAIEIVEYKEQSNMWVGIRKADLIHLGAKYAACMRRDTAMMQEMLIDAIIENRTACCIRVDGSGCYQASEAECLYPRGKLYAKTSLNEWRTWRNEEGPYARSSGSVCHQDPRYCRNPQTPQGFQLDWPDDLSKWPICKLTYDIHDLPSNIDHMTCDITGRPCCIGIQGECVITTREDCLFHRGFYHEELNLCSQVHCLEETCGMTAFFNSDYPDQFYRLFISLFLHAGAIQLAMSILFQLTVMRDLEKLAGSLRIAIIYIGSGIAGNLVSAIILPHHVDVGPSGSQFGLLACLFVEIIQNWKMLKKPSLALLRLSLVLFSLFILGLLPMVDNCAHLAGFFSGLLLAFAFLPYITFNSSDARFKISLIIVCLLAYTILLSCLFFIFYFVRDFDCDVCRYFNCLPVTADFCAAIPVAVVRNRREL